MISRRPSRENVRNNLGHKRFLIPLLLKVFLRRFFANQFKRSCFPDGPKVGMISLSPRGDWRMPSDAEETLWLRWAEQ